MWKDIDLRLWILLHYNMDLEISDGCTALLRLDFFVGAWRLTKKINHYSAVIQNIKYEKCLLQCAHCDKGQFEHRQKFYVSPVFTMFG